MQRSQRAPRLSFIFDSDCHSFSVVITIDIEVIELVYIYTCKKTQQMSIINLHLLLEKLRSRWETERGGGQGRGIGEEKVEGGRKRWRREMGARPQNFHLLNLRSDNFF